MGAIQKARRAVLGDKLDPFDPSTRHRMALIAFLAWIGIGADGLSSACYGPEEAFLALGPHASLALYLAAATAITVFVISLAYNQVIDLFPSGGGGYKAATKLIGPKAGLVSGSALIVDYVLTIAISVASGADAFFSFLPEGWHSYKLATEALVVGLLLTLNLRGMKESIRLLAPIFLGFVFTHLALIVYGIHAHADGLGQLIPATLEETRALTREQGWMFVVALFLRAYSMGGGTYTGIEAVSNNVNMLAEPRVRTGHWTMFYMALSLALTAGGIILLYLLWNAQPVVGQTLNAVTFRAIIESAAGVSQLSSVALVAVLCFEAGLLLVAANTGFLGGPSVLASMASDRWVPRQFRQLSSRMVTQNGVLLMGISALVILLATKGKVSLLVVLYSINVFLTFSLTLFGLCRHWLEQRRYSRRWRAKLALAMLGLVVTSSMLVVLIAEKFMMGAWITVLITGAVAAVCLAVRRHYDEVRHAMSRVDHAFAIRPHWSEDAPGPPLDPKGLTAIVLLGSSLGSGMKMLEWIRKMFPDRFHNFVFVSAGEVDKDNFDSALTLNALQARLQSSLSYFTSYCASQGLAATSFETYGADPLDALTHLLPTVFEQYPENICFASRLVFKDENLFTQLLHNQLPLAVQRRLHAEGRHMIIVPVPVPELAPQQQIWRPIR